MRTFILECVEGGPFAAVGGTSFQSEYSYLGGLLLRGVELLHPVANPVISSMGQYIHKDRPEAHFPISSVVINLANPP